MSDETEKVENDALLDRMDKAALDLKEHFDSVTIFCTLHRDDTKNTTHMTVGKGNWYARFGQVVEWVISQDQKSRDHETRSTSEPNE